MTPAVPSTRCSSPNRARRTHRTSGVSWPERRLSELHDVAERIAGNSGGADSHDVLWVSRFTRSDGQVRTTLHVAPLSVAALLREKLFAERTVVLTSATLSTGRQLRHDGRSGGAARDEQAPQWQAMDVGSPFDYRRQAILYIAAQLPPPGRDGLSAAAMDELAALVEAAGGRTLGLFSSRRAAEYAAELMRERLDLPVLCQGDDQTPTLVRAFARTRAPVCSGRCRCGRGWTCRGRPVSWWWSTGSRSRDLTTR